MFLLKTKQDEQKRNVTENTKRKIMYASASR
jgi:hypothetical protein